MNNDHTNKLYSDYPELYSKRDLPITRSPMRFGFSCGDGWFKLIDTLSKEIKELVDSQEHITIQAEQVKEKFGGLRFYYSISNKNNEEDPLPDDPSVDKLVSKIEALVSNAESLSYKICDVCGEPGSPTNNGWVSTRCEEHKSSRG